MFRTYKYTTKDLKNKLKRSGIYWMERLVCKDINYKHLPYQSLGTSDKETITWTKLIFFLS